MNPRLRALLERKQKAVDAAKAISDLAAKENRDLTEDERKQFDAHLGSAATLQADIDREKALIEAERGAQALPAAGEGARVTENLDRDGTRGFRSMGEFASVVVRAAVHGDVDRRLLPAAAAPTTYGSEQVGADGGYLVPTEYSREVFRHVLEDDSILPLTDNLELDGNSMTFPKDETTPWGTDGIRAYWSNEAAAATATKPKLSTATLRMHKLLALVPVTEELLADANALDAFITNAAGASIRWKANEAFFAGSGAGQPQGILAHAATVDVAKESGQAAATVKVENIAKMFARMPAASLGRSVWMCNNDVLPQLITMVLNNYPIFIPPTQSIANAPAGMLMGRPLRISQHCKTLGTSGDIAFVDWKYYRTITKRGGVAMATSMHLYFDADAQAFRFTFRVDGQPKIGASITPANGSNNLSPFVTLAVRA